MFTRLLLGAEAPLQTTRPGYGCPCRAPSPSPEIPTGSQPFSSTLGCFPPSFSHNSGVSLEDADAPTLPHALGHAAPPSSPHRPLLEASRALLRCFGLAQGPGAHPAIQDMGGLSPPPDIKGDCRHPYVRVRYLPRMLQQQAGACQPRLRAQGQGKHPLWESSSALRGKIKRKLIVTIVT